MQVPIPSMEEMTLKIQCESCGARSAVIGSAFFCPCCGHNSVERTFDDSLAKVEAKLNNIHIIRQSLIKAELKDEAETTCRSLIETSLSDCVVAFQRYLEEVYKKRPIQTRFRSASGPLGLRLAVQTNSPAHYAKSTPSLLRAPTAYKRAAIVTGKQIGRAHV